MGSNKTLNDYITINKTPSSDNSPPDIDALSCYSHNQSYNALINHFLNDENNIHACGYFDLYDGIKKIKFLGLAAFIECQINYDLGAYSNIFLGLSDRFSPYVNTINSLYDMCYDTINEPFVTDDYSHYYKKMSFLMYYKKFMKGAV